MPRNTQPLTNWHGDSWSPVVGHAIDRRLVKDWGKIANIIRPIYQKNHSEIDINQLATQRAFEIEFNALIQDLSNELRRAWGILRDVNRSGSDAQIYRTLQALIHDPKDIQNQIWSIDLGTRSFIEDHHTDGPLALEDQFFNEEKTITACQHALKSLPTPKPSRPKGTKNHAQISLAIALAEIYARHVAMPTRIFDSEKNTFRGPFKDFVQAIMDLIPVQLKRKKDGGTRLVDHMVQIGVESQKKA